MISMVLQYDIVLSVQHACLAHNQLRPLAVDRLTDVTRRDSRAQISGTPCQPFTGC
jgi:hypothetical protein